MDFEEFAYNAKLILSNRHLVCWLVKNLQTIIRNFCCLCGCF